jgi:type III pantothenate kinase
MNLALDFGNTRIKAAIFNGSEMTRHMVFENAPAFELALDSLPELQHVVIGTVTSAHEGLLSALKKRAQVFVFSGDTAVPLKNLYKSARTLGSDRLSAAVGAYLKFPKKNILVIDAGTCIKYNFHNEKGEYLGGAISPGIPMRLKAMHEFTHALPEVKAEPDYALLTGGSTKESLLTGAIVAAACEADGMIDRYKEKYPGLQVILTGGDTEYLSRLLKNPFFADPHLILEGLNAILEYNLVKK